MSTWSYSLTVKNLTSPTTVRQYLSKHLWIPKHLIFALRKQQHVWVNEEYRPMSFPIKNGEKLQLTFVDHDFSLPVQNLMADDSVKPTILYEDDDVLVVNKPRGYKTHPNQPGETNTLLNFCEAYLNQSNQHAYMIHRLDQHTSGAIIVGKNPAVVPILVRLIKEKVIHRTYLAWVKGKFTNPSGTIDKPIGYDDDDKRKRQINGRNAKPAVTDYEVIQTKGNYSLVKLVLHTGRTHQIRVHLASLVHPIVGDPLYNNDDNDEMLLHSWQLKLIRPYYLNELTITSPLPKAMKKFEYV